MHTITELGGPEAVSHVPRKCDESGQVSETWTFDAEPLERRQNWSMANPKLVWLLAAAELLHPVKPTPGLTGAPVRSAWTGEGSARPHTSLASKLM